MRLIGFELDGARHIGRVDGDVVTDLGDIRAFYAAGGAVSEISATYRRKDLVEAPPVPDTARVFCVGINYHDHADEAKQGAGLDLPAYPMIFGRWAQSLVVDGTVVPLPPNEPGLDWEVELAVVIKDETWGATQDDALDHVLGYTAFNDLTARNKQLETPQFTLGKNPDKSGPIGPVLVRPTSCPPELSGCRCRRESTVR